MGNTVPSHHLMHTSASAMLRGRFFAAALECAAGSSRRWGHSTCRLCFAACKGSVGSHMGSVVGNEQVVDDDTPCRCWWQRPALRLYFCTIACMRKMPSGYRQAFWGNMHPIDCAGRPGTPANNLALSLFSCQFHSCCVGFVLLLQFVCINRVEVLSILKTVWLHSRRCSSMWRREYAGLQSNINSSLAPLLCQRVPPSCSVSMLSLPAAE